MNLNWGGWIFSSFVLPLLWFLSMMLKDPVRLSIKGKRAKGIVVAMTKVEDSQHDTLRVPVVEFVTSTGERARVSGRFYSSSPSARVGDAVSVAYSRSNPRNAQFLSWKEFPLGPAGFLLGFTAVILLIWGFRLEPH